MFHPARLARSPERPRESSVPTRTPNRPKKYLFCHRKGAEVPDLNVLKLCATLGFSGQFDTKSLFLGQNKYIFGRFGGNMGTINTSTQSGVLRRRLKVITSVQTEVTILWFDR